MGSGDSLSQWLNSDMFIVLLVLVVLLLVVIFAVCWLMRRHHAMEERMAEIEIIQENPSRFTLKIVTEQTHATELVEMLTRRTHSVPHDHSVPSTSGLTTGYQQVTSKDSDQDYKDAL